MSHFISLPAVKPTVLTEEQRDALSELAARFRRAYPELDTLTAPFDAEANDDTTPDDSALGSCITNGCLDNCYC